MCNETFRVERKRELTARVGRSKTDSLAADVNRSNSSATSMNTALECFVRILSNRKLRAVELKAPTDIHNAYEYQVNSHP